MSCKFFNGTYFMRKLVGLLILISFPAFSSDPTAFFYVPLIFIASVLTLVTLLTLFVKNKKKALGFSLVTSLPALSVGLFILNTSLRYDEAFDLPLTISFLSVLPIIFHIGRCIKH